MDDHLTVSELATYIKALVQRDEVLNSISVLGEISKPLHAKSGHLYFVLKDDEASLNCVMWRFAVQRLPEIPRDGDQVVVYGAIDFYGPRGQLQLVASALRPAGGVGDIYRRYEETKARLQEEGLFATERKRPLPRFPRKVAIITSATGAALRDFLRVLRQRWPLVEVLLVPSLVQGAEAPASLRAALQQVYRRSDIDVIVLARGGGSMEDLWAFNDEALARLIAASPVPVVSGVGHETDFTIADFVADWRAPTPTAAAAAIVPDAATLRQNLDATIARLGEIVEQRLREQRVLVNHAVQRLAAQAPYQRLQQQRLLVNELQSRLWRVQQGTLQRQRLLLLGQQQQLQALNPRRVLARGYALVRDEDGHVIRSTSQISPDQPLSVEVSDGTFPVVVGKTTAETH